ncbi:UNVERIFIED_CONTAM: hypothetical protein Slati_1485300 [Sesamum latifolium]|uniref:Uncharacterized protein n=1 Tax=Sesamum latifolium TaxID=2727402 RepID=A0AAW2X605_9LAMI
MAMRGDYNEILQQHEKDGLAPRAQWQINDFRQCFNECGLYDMGYKGNCFTWCKGREAPHTVRAHLDCACCSTRWTNVFPKAQAQHEVTSGSDHSALWVDLDPKVDAEKQARNKRFRFEAIWSKSEDCDTIIKQSWRTWEPQNQQEQFINRIRGVGLLKWDKGAFGNIRKQARELDKQIRLLK